MSTYVSVSHLRVEQERASDLVDAFRRRAHLVDDANGFERIEVWQGSNPGEILMVSWWRDRTCFTEYMRSAEHRSSPERIPEDLLGAIKLERLEHLIGYEIVAG